MSKHCSITGCTNKYRAIGYCSSHWKTFKKYGTATPVCWCGELAQTFTGNYTPTNECPEHTTFRRFVENIQIKGPNDCWEWAGSKTSANYGLLYVNGKLEYAHRFSLELDGRPVPDRHHACHSCDNPPCVNPAHLFVGTPLDNTLDKVQKNRHTYGEKHPHSKLSNEDVATIRVLFEQGVWQADLARQFNVNSSHISNIVNNLVRRTS